MEKKTQIEVGKVYEIGGQKYVIDEIGFNVIYGFVVDESHTPQGRRRRLGTLKRKEVKLIT